MKLTRARLRRDKALIGFVGGPFTLYVYAAAGSHENAAQALQGLQDGTYAAFNEKLLDLLAANMALQSRAGADCVALFDTAAGEIDAATYGRFVVPVLPIVSAPLVPLLLTPAPLRLVVPLLTSVAPSAPPTPVPACRRSTA